MVAKLGASRALLHDGEVEAANWMTALRATRQAMSERPCCRRAQAAAWTRTAWPRSSTQVRGASSCSRRWRRGRSDAPPAANKAGAPRRRRPSRYARGGASTPRRSCRKRREPPVEVRIDTAPTEAAPAAPPEPRSPPAIAAPRQQARVTAMEKVRRRAGATRCRSTKKKFQTVAFSEGFPEPMCGARSALGRAAERAHARIRRTRRAARARRSSSRCCSSATRIRRPETRSATASAPICCRAARPCRRPKPRCAGSSPICSRSWRAAAARQVRQPRRLRSSLEDAPERPPVITLQWRDWRNEVAVDYPAAARLSSLPPRAGRRTRRSPRGCVRSARCTCRACARRPKRSISRCACSRQMIPAEATSACLYDINTDELRFVALSGTGAAELQGPSRAARRRTVRPGSRAEHHSSIFHDVMVEPLFVPAIDGRARRWRAQRAAAPDRARASAARHAAADQPQERATRSPRKT